MANRTDEAPRRLNTEHAAQYLGDDVSPRTLERWRVTGGGPVYIRFGKRVVYDTRDLDVWLASKRRQSTTVALGTSKAA